MHELGKYVMTLGRGLPLLALVAGLAAPARGATTITRIVMLPLAGRTSVVVELTEPVSHLEHAQPNPTSVLIEGGPVAPGLTSRTLEPAGPSSLVSGISLSSFTRPDGPYFRLQIALTARAVHTLRSSGSRLYVDLSPPEEEPAARSDDVPAQGRDPAPVTVRPAVGARERPTDAATSKPRAAAPRSADSGQAQPQPDASTSSTGASTSPVDPDTAYRDLESATLQRARELAGRPDVKGLLRLKESVQKRDDQLGKLQPDLIRRILDELTRLTDEARALQLARDRWTFKP